MRRGQRPSRHVRRVPTKRGRQARLINPHLRRFRWHLPRRRVPPQRMSPQGRRVGAPGFQHVMDDSLAFLEDQAIKTAEREQEAHEEILAKQEALRAKQEALNAETSRLRGLRTAATKARADAYDKLAAAATQATERAEALAVDVFGRPGALERLEAGLTPYATEAFEAGLGTSTPVRMSRRDQAQHALDLARKTGNRALIARAQEAVTQLGLALEMDTAYAKGQRTSLTQRHGAETVAALRGKKTLTEEDVKTLKLLDPKYWTPGGFVTNPELWRWDATQRKLVPRTEPRVPRSGEFPETVPAKGSVQAMTPEELETAIAKAQKDAAELGKQERALLEQAAREKVGLSGRGSKKARRALAAASEDPAFDQAIAAPTDVVKLRIVDDEELP